MSKENGAGFGSVVWVRGVGSDRVRGLGFERWAVMRHAVGESGGEQTVLPRCTGEVRSASARACA